MVASNPSFGSHLFPREGRPELSPVWVPKEKSAGVKRAVLVGASAAAGFPDPEFNLARFVRILWSLKADPASPLEVVNLTMVGVNTHVLRRFVREALDDLDPDVLILYAGHNEVIGPFGPASVFGGSGWSPWQVQVLMWIRSLHLTTGLQALWQMMIPGADAAPAWRGLDEFRQAVLSADDPRLVRLYRNAEENVRWMLDRAADHGVPVVLAVPAVNLQDWPPLGGEEALRVYRAAQEDEQAGNRAAAWIGYRKACDLDRYRFRADSRLREGLRKLAAAYPDHVVRLADTDRDLHEGNAGFVSDRVYFYEHVHLTFDGRLAVAASLVREMVPLLECVPVDRLSPAGEEVASRLPFVAWNEMEAWRAIRALLDLEVFRQQPGRDLRRRELDARIEALAQQAQLESRPGQMMAVVEKARRLNPADPLVDLVGGQLLLAQGLLGPAMEALTRCLERFPNHPDVLLNLSRIALMQGNLPEAGRHLDAFARVAPESVRHAPFRGEYLARTGRLEEAIPLLEQAVVWDPGKAANWANLAQAWVLKGNMESAILCYERAVFLDARDGHVLNNLAWLLATEAESSRGQRERAVALAKRALEREPANPRFKGTLAVACLAAGQPQDACRWGRQAIRELAAIGDDEGVTQLRQHLDSACVFEDEAGVSRLHLDD